MTSKPVIFSPTAERNLKSIFRYIAKASSPRIAERYVASIRVYCEELGVAPIRGENLSSRSPGLRLVGFSRSATIAFRVLPDAVLVTGVYYRGRDVRADL